MSHRMRQTLFLCLAVLVPGSAVCDEPADPPAKVLSPWAGIRQTLREQERKSLPFTSAPERRIHKQVPAAVKSALTWLAAHQSPGGRWEAAGFGRWSGGQEVPEGERADGPGLALYDVGVSGLALSAFLVAGYTGAGEHAFDETVRRGLDYLKGTQDEEGCYGTRVVSPVGQRETAQHRAVPFGRRADPPEESGAHRDRQTFVYNHATAALAMVEAFGLTGSTAWKASAQRGLDFIALAKNPYFAWRYGVKPGDNDTSVTGWMMMPLETARRINRAAVAAESPAPFTLDEEAFDGIKAWIDKMTDPDYGRVGYLQRGGPPARQEALFDRFPPDWSEAMTAVGMLARIFAGEDPSQSKHVKLGIGLLQKRPPAWDQDKGTLDMIYWHFGTLAMHQVGVRKKYQSSAARRLWGQWLHTVETLLLEHQRADGDVSGAKGSWDPAGAWGEAGGRVYATALNVLTLLTPVRYERRLP